MLMIYIIDEQGICKKAKRDFPVMIKRCTSKSASTFLEINTNNNEENIGCLICTKTYISKNASSFYISSLSPNFIILIGFLNNMPFFPAKEGFIKTKETEQSYKQGIKPLDRRTKLMKIKISHTNCQKATHWTEPTHSCPWSIYKRSKNQKRI